MKKEQPKKVKKVRKTGKKDDVISSESSHDEESGILFPGNDLANQHKQSKIKSEVEESDGKNINDSETGTADEIQQVNEFADEKIREEVENVIEEQKPDIPEESVAPEKEEIKEVEKVIPQVDEETEPQNIQETQPQSVEDTQIQEEEDAKPRDGVTEEEIKEKEKPEKIFPKSNYQISLINENLLRIVVETENPVGVDCIVKNKKPDDGDSTQIQSNKILVHPKEDGKLQEVEIIVSINKTESVKVDDKQEESAPGSVDEQSHISDEEQNKPRKKFLIDPSVADILQKPSRFETDYEYKPMTREEYFEEKLKPHKNKYVINRAIVEKNLKIGIVTAIIIAVFSMIVYSGLSTENDAGDEQKPQRLIVIQDIPDMKVDIPLEKKDDGSGDDEKSIVTPKINIRRNPIRTPRIEITKKDTTSKPDSTDIAKNNEELDKLRKRDGDTTGTGTSVSGINSTDTLNANAVSLPFGLYGWMLIDSLDYGGRKFKFSSDTSQVIKDPSDVGKISDFKMFVIQDIKGIEFSCGRNLKDFPVSVLDYKAYKCEPREELLSNQLEYMYRIINKDNTYAITIKVEYKKEYKPEYYPKVDSLISKIRLPEFPK